MGVKMHIEFTKNQKKLLNNILSIVLIVDILYGLLVFVFISQMQLLKFLASSELITIVMVAVFVMIANKLFIKRSKFEITTKPGSKPSHENQKTKRPIQSKPRLKQTKLPSRTEVGSSRCPICKKFTYGIQCTHCGTRLVVEVREYGNKID